MHSLISFSKSWLGSLIGLVILACLIYFLGPAVGIKGVHPLSSEFNRYVAIGLLFVCWAYFSERVLARSCRVRPAWQAV